MAPIIGAPSGVVPMNAMVYSAMTRPRIDGSALTCSTEFARAMYVTLNAPANGNATIAHQMVGMTDTTSTDAPNQVAERMRREWVGRSEERRVGRHCGARWCMDGD